MARTKEELAEDIFMRMVIASRATNKEVETDSTNVTEKANFELEAMARYALKASDAWSSVLAEADKPKDTQHYMSNFGAVRSVGDGWFERKGQTDTFRESALSQNEFVAVTKARAQAQLKGSIDDIWLLVGE